MPRRSIVPLTLGLAVGGVAMGAYAGGAAIGELPDFYAEAYSAHYRSFADLVPNGPGYDAPAGLEAANGCIGCDGLGTGLHPWTQHAVFTDEQLGISGELPADPQPVAMAEIGIPDEPPVPSIVGEGPSAIARYSGFPVTQEEMREREMAPDRARSVPALAANSAACTPADCVPVGM